MLTKFNLFSKNISQLFQGDYFALELLEGYLYLHMNLGSGGIKFRASNRRLSDSSWHRVEILRNQRHGKDSQA